MKGILNYEKNKIKLFVTLSFALLMAFGNVNSVSAAKSTTKSTPYGTGTKVTFYGTHDAIHTTGYHVYTSTQY